MISAANALPSQTSLPTVIGKLEPPRTRAARIEVKHAIAHLLLRHMAVPGNDNLESRGFRLQIEVARS